MKRHGYLFEKLYDFHNLLVAFAKSFKGMRKKEVNSEYYFFLEGNLLSLQSKLKSQTYLPSKYRYFTIYEPKERLISVASFEDRIVHHALVNVLEPIYEKIFIYDSYATRKGKGSHRAIARAQYFLKRNRWFLKIDIEKYFGSIDHLTLINIIKRKIKDPHIIELISLIVKNNDISQNVSEAIGLPIGNLTSQFLANIYLDQFDHYVKEELRFDYIRYMDDMVFFSNDKDRLKETLHLAEEYLGSKLKLTIKPVSIILNTRIHGLSFLGFRIYPTIIRVKKENIKRMKKNVKKREWEYNEEIISEAKLSQSVNSIIEFIKTANSERLRQNIYG
jgi:retron-type reverse transcriptase